MNQPRLHDETTVWSVAKEFLTRARRSPAEHVRLFLGETIWHWDLNSMSPVNRRIVVALRLLYLVGRGFVSSRAQQQAMALTYTTMLALVPAFAIMVAVLSLRGLEGAKLRLQGFLVEFVSASEQQEQQIIQFLNDLVENMAVSRGVAGIAFFVFLFFTIVSLLSTLEKTLNDIWGVQRGRSFINKFVTYWCIATLGPIFLGAALVQGSSLGQRFEDVRDWGAGVSTRWLSQDNEDAGATAGPGAMGPAFPGVAGEFAREFVEDQARAESAGEEATDSLERITEGARAAGGDTLGFLISLALTIITFTLLYAFLPHARVRLKPALIGAVTAALLWAATKWALALSSSTLVKYDAVYGGLATVPITMFWLYLTWLIVILGAEVTVAIQNIRSQRRDELSSETTQVFQERVALRLVATIAQLFEKGELPPDGESLAERTGAPMTLCTSLLYHLTEDGLLREIDLGGEASGYVPAKPLDKITVSDVIDSLRVRRGVEFELREGRDLDVIEEHLLRADQASKALSGRVSLRQLAEALERGEELVASPAPVSQAAKSAILRAQSANLRASLKAVAEAAGRAIDGGDALALPASAEGSGEESAPPRAAGAGDGDEHAGDGEGADLAAGAAVANADGGEETS
jgi:uncharacterized BrkB/YihY/UPF0761 family membrane protein